MREKSELLVQMFLFRSIVLIYFQKSVFTIEIICSNLYQIYIDSVSPFVSFSSVFWRMTRKCSSSEIIHLGLFLAFSVENCVYNLYFGREGRKEREEWNKVEREGDVQVA